ncbi:MAG: hypothetical protein GY844_03655, partial [Bradyrhizobium sp.]|nr:hypothetical protein [Bradyrhizobium sp.]
MPRVAVEDDELEFVDLLLKQFAGRKCDQRQFVDRGAVLFLGSIRLLPRFPRSITAGILAVVLTALAIGTSLLGPEILLSRFVLIFGVGG